MTQWHPLFVKLLRPLVEDYFEIETNLPVGDVPRQADLVLLRRTSAKKLPYRGLWRNLTTWNILECKGPSVSPRRGDLDLLVELGLGIDRRLNQERIQRGAAPLVPQQVSFWYLANRLGRRFLRDASLKLENLEALLSGVWRSQLLQHEIYLVSGRDLPVDQDSVPLHLVGREDSSTDKEVARFLAQSPALWRLYGSWLALLHKMSWEEVRDMARASKELKLNWPSFSEASKVFGSDLRPLIEHLGLKEVIRQMGLKRVIDEVGLKQVIDEVGLKQVIDEVGPERVVGELLEHLTAAQRRGLKHRLQQMDS